MSGLGTKDPAILIFIVISEASSVGPWWKKLFSSFQIYLAGKPGLADAVKRGQLPYKAGPEV
jgi:hypothetical protein